MRFLRTGSILLGLAVLSGTAYSAETVVIPVKNANTVLSSSNIVVPTPNLINVTVNGSPVTFSGTGAQMIKGHVFVPLRGVLEKMDAFVGWDDASHTVLAQRGARGVVLPIGAQTAKVNGKDVSLDAPASMVGGTTLVPLRFLSEALGAGVKWNGSTRTVEIEARESNKTAGTASGPEVRSFTTNASGWLTAGDRVKLVLLGTSHGLASFEIPNVAPRTTMKEITPGKYEAVWVVPADTRNITSACAVAKLTVGDKHLIIQSGTPIGIDVTPPQVKNVLPAPDTNTDQTRPGISAMFDDEGSGINPTTVKLSMNGTDITDLANITPTFISFRSDTPMSGGEKNVTLSVADKAGNTFTTSWKFNIKEAAKVIKAVNYSMPTNAIPGEVISFRMEAETGGTGRCWFLTSDGKKIREQAMQETTPGIYEAEYTIRRGDALAGVSVVAAIKTAAGESYTLQADKKIGGQVSAQVAPSSVTITSPVDGAFLPSPVVVKGTGTPGTQVKMVVSYVAPALGALKVNGTLVEEIVTVDEHGKFQSEPIILGTMVGANGADYTLTATTIGADGKESTPTIVKFRQQ